MLGFFTDPFPDELLYSVCARYAKRTAYLNKQSVISELFGKRGLAAIVDFPTRLNHLISVLPRNHNYSAEQFINKNSLLPYFQPFLPSKRAELARAEMKEDGVPNRIRSRLGTRVKQIKNPSYLRFCPNCVFEDRKAFGETYWHRIHQLPGILVCPDHQCFLEESSVRLGRMSSKFFHDAETFVPSKLPRINKLDFQYSSQRILHKIAIDAKWLLVNANIQIAIKEIRDRYFNRLLSQGLAYYNGRLKHNKLIQTCQEFFPSEMFQVVGCLSDKPSWLTVLAHPGNVETTFHPIRHLLLLTFLGLSAREFFTKFIEFKPFGYPPYPCLNQASNHYKKLTIQKCEIFDNISKESNKQGIPLGIFRCDCGFVYQRLGPDKSEDNKFEFSLVKEYGDTWEGKFKELWAETTISGGEISRQMGISQTSVGRQAIRLNLPMNSNGTRFLQGYSRHRNPNKSFSETLEEQRNRWLQIRSIYPYLTRKQLLNQANTIYLWLKRNDADWFEKHIPLRTTGRKKQPLLDWEQNDVELSEKVSIVCNEILSLLDFPVRVCISEIVKRIGYKVWIDKRQKKLPLTSKIIDENLETLEEFMIRKIEWTKKQFIKEREVPSRPQFVIRAVVRNQTSFGSSKIQKAIRDALIEIEESLNSTL